jgi:hypothetical protein
MGKAQRAPSKKSQIRSVSSFGSRIQAQNRCYSRRPFIPSRTRAWVTFRARVKPVCFYLEKEPEYALCGLLERHYRHRQIPHLADDAGFGCWDQGSTTDLQGGRWVLLPWDRALENTRRNMAGITPYYERDAVDTFTWRERATEAGRARLNQAISDALAI